MKKIFFLILSVFLTLINCSQTDNSLITNKSSLSFKINGIQYTSNKYYPIYRSDRYNNWFNQKNGSYNGIIGFATLSDITDDLILHLFSKSQFGENTSDGDIWFLASKDYLKISIKTPDFEITNWDISPIPLNLNELKVQDNEFVEFNIKGSYKFNKLYQDSSCDIEISDINFNGKIFTCYGQFFPYISQSINYDNFDKNSNYEFIQERKLLICAEMDDSDNIFYINNKQEIGYWNENKKNFKYLSYLLSWDSDLQQYSIKNISSSEVSKNEYFWIDIPETFKTKNGKSIGIPISFKDKLDFN